MRAGSHVKGLVHRLKDDGLDDLVPSLKHTRNAVADWWRVPRLTSYTDHSHHHSSRVANRAHTLATIRRLPEGVELSAQEAYLLEMASWVHDIGMQAVSAPDAVDPTFPSDPDLVRRNHAMESFNFLMGDASDGFSLGLPPNYDSTVQFIAWLALAHGTHSYRRAVDHLAGVPRLNDRDVRGPLIAALLLMADELDLHAERAAAYGAVEELGEISTAHWLKHECVDDVRVSVRDSGEGEKIHISITLKTFKGMTPSQFDEVRYWVRDKLQVQMALIEREVTAGFKNHVAFDRDVEIMTSKLGGRANPRLRDSVIAVMAADNARAKLINHGECHRGVREALDADQSVVIVGEDVGVREDGREDVFALACAEERASGRRVLFAIASPGVPSPTASDVLASWLDDAGEAHHSDEDEHENERRARLLDMVIDFVGVRTPDVVLAVSGFDSLQESDRDWIIGVAMVKLAEVQWLLTSSRPLAGMPVSTAANAGWTQVTVGDTPTEALRLHLSRYVSERTASKMISAGTTYSNVRRFGLFGVDD